MSDENAFLAVYTRANEALEKGDTATARKFFLVAARLADEQAATGARELSEKRREELFLEIQEKAVSCAVGIVEPKEIDRINILQATYAAMRQAVGKLSCVPQVLLNDAVEIPGLPKEIKQVKIIRGDAKSLSIAAASVLAKVTRDHLMTDYDKQYPNYGFAKHKGYGTAAHIQALKDEGPCPLHRRTFIGKFVKADEGEEADKANG